MQLPAKVIVETPATVGNVGPGFDTLGLALGIRTAFELTRHSGNNPKAPGDDILVRVRHDADDLDYAPPHDAEEALSQIAERFREYTGCNLTSMEVSFRTCLPVHRGLGSSAAAIVGFLSGLRATYAPEMSDRELLNLAAAIEGHPDQIVPALVGGVTASILTDRDEVRFVRLPPPQWELAVAIPNARVSTLEARKVLPTEVTFENAVHGVSRTALLVAALAQSGFASITPGSPDPGDDADNIWGVAIDDRLHEPARSKLNPAYIPVRKTALDAGADAVFLSGSGPTIIALRQLTSSKTDQTMGAIGRRMSERLKEAGFESEMVYTRPSERGTVVQIES